VCRFGLPHTIISDNGTYFASKQVASFYLKYKITYWFSIPYYPADNDHVEISNHTILDSLCKSLTKAKGKLVEKIPGMLWAYKPTKCILMRETPFSLAYGMKAIILINICMPTVCTEEINRGQNAIQLHLVQDQSEERQREAQICIAAYQQQIKATHHKKVRVCEFQVDDLVLSIMQNTKEKNVGKLRPNWEGLYIMVAKGGNGSYTADQDEKTLRKQWNSFHLKWYYM